MLDRLFAFLRSGLSAAPSAQPEEPGAAVAMEEAPLAPLLRAAGFARAEMWAEVLARPMRTFGIHTPMRRAAFLATIAHESDGGRVLVENKRYSAQRLMQVWPKRFPTLEAAQPFAWDPTDEDREDVALANLVYGSRMGNQRNGVNDDDGWRYRGRGLIQITGADNYRSTGEALNLPLLSNPDMAAEPAFAAEIAACWWSAHGCNDLADRGDVEAWRRRVNGGVIGLADVRRRYDAVMACR